MRHGIDGYFQGLARDQRRTSLIGIAVALLLLAAEFLARQPRLVAALNDPRRFGFEGTEQYVRRILLEPTSDFEQPGANKANYVPVELHAGGGKKPQPLTERSNLPGGTARGVGEGTDDQTLIARVRALALSGPVVRSEDLVVEKLVRPEYPDAAINANIEGRVELVALVDTTGAVTEVHIIGGSHDPDLERAATSAALQCRYRPYRLHDQAAQRVWAYFRVNFSLY